MERSRDRQAIGAESDADDESYYFMETLTKVKISRFKSPAQLVRINICLVLEFNVFDWSITCMIDSALVH